MQGADLALVNARVHTMEPSRPRAEAVLVRGGRIALVGTTREVLEARRGEPLLDCGGRTVVPGFVDGHCHFEMTCTALTHCVPLHAPPYTSLADMARALRERARQTPPGRWLIGRSSFNLYAKVAEGRLFTREELDRVTTRHPLVVFAGFHVAMMNTRALQELGLWGPGASPPRGVTLHRDEAGLPTGVATEVWDMLPPFSVAEVKGAIRARAGELFLSQGITTVHTIPFHANDVQAVRELQEEGALPLRVRLYFHVPHHTSLEALTSLGLPPGFGDPMMRLGGVKVFIDGTGHDGLGNFLLDLKWTQEELDDFVARAHRAGLQLWMHTTTVPSIRMATEAVARAVRAYPRPHRHRLEHGGDFIAEEGDIRRVKEAGLWLVATPQFLYSAGEGARGRTPRGTRLRTLIDQGFPVIGASDSTGTVPDAIGPLFNIYCAVARRTHLGRVLGPEEAITPEEGLKMFTIWSAMGGFEEGEKGSIAPGKLGDFALLSADPLEVEPEALREIRVEATIIGGRVVYEG